MTEEENERIAIMVYDGGLSEKEAIAYVEAHRQFGSVVARLREKAEKFNRKLPAKDLVMPKSEPVICGKLLAAGDNE